MNLYLIRHNEARPVGGEIIRDADRPLTDDGERIAGLMGRMLALVDPSIGLILTSSLKRARQTGEIIGRELRKGVTIRVSENLAPGLPSKAFIKELSSLGEEKGVVAVGHQPDMSSLISTLIAGTSHAAVAMATGAVAKIVVQPPSRHLEAHLEWLLTPDLLRKIHSMSDRGT